MAQLGIKFRPKLTVNVVRKWHKSYKIEYHMIFDFEKKICLTSICTVDIKLSLNQVQVTCGSDCNFFHFYRHSLNRS